MRSLIRKELAETFLPASPILAIACALVVAGVDPSDALLRRHPSPPTYLLGGVGILGVALGYLRFAVEDWSGGWPFLLHRGTSHPGAFFAKVFAGLATVALGSLGVVLVWVAWQWIASPLAPVLQWRWLGEYAVLSTFGPSAYAAGVLAAQVRRGTVAVLALLFAMPMGLVAPTIALAVRGEAVPFLLFQVAATALLLAVAWRLFRGGIDQDLALTARAHAALALSGGVLFLLSVALGTAWVQASLLEELVDRQPKLVRDRTSGEVRVAAREEGLKSSYNYGVLSLIAPLRPGSGEPVKHYDILYDPADSHVERVDDGHLDWKERWVELYIVPPGVFAYIAADAGFHPRAFLDLRDGDVHVVYETVPQMFWEGDRAVRLPELILPEALPFERVLVKPGGGRFSTATTVLWAGASVCIADPLDRSLWRIDAADPEHALKPVELPAGDSFVALEPLYRRVPLTSGIRSRATWLVVGERGRYSWRSASWVPTAEDGFHAYEPGADADFATESESAALVERRVVLVNGDPIEPVVEVREAASGALLSSYRGSAEGLVSASLAASLHAGVLMRPPVVNVGSYFSPALERSLRGRKLPHFEPLFAGGARPLLLAVHLALTVLWTALAWRGLRRRGAPAGIVALTVVFVILAGIAGYVLYKMLEPRPVRAAQPAVARAEILPELRFESA